VSLPDLAGRTAVVTGASRGLGAGLAADFSRRGMHLGLCSRGAPALSPSDRVVAERLDVRDEAALRAFVARVAERFGAIDLWINNAGVLEPVGPLRQLEAEAFREHIDINLTGVFLGSREYLRHLRATGGEGVLVNISSGAAWHGYQGWSAYCAGKAAVERLTECVAMEEGGTGLRAFSVAPGVIDTEMQELIRDCSPERFPSVDRFLELKREGRFNTPGFVARHLLEIAFDPERKTEECAIRLPDEASSP
jgi:NAD(P)-dependent dehydrogenase (short-subunit alcohol dehydrogenase family)